MKEKNHIIFGVHITERVKHVPEVQKILTEFGCFIKTRLGLHDVSETYCAPNGLLILEMAGDDAKIEQCAKKLKAVEGVDMQRMEFEHP
jgi:hypothetical protein